MHLRSIGLLAALLCPALVSAADMGTQERETLAHLALQDYTVVYEDTDGKRIDFETINNAVAAGTRYDLSMDLEKRTAVLRLTNAEPAPTPAPVPGSEEHGMLEAFGMNGYTVGYKAADGSRIDFEAFFKATREGQTFTQYKNPKTRKAVLALDEPGSPSQDAHAGHAQGATAAHEPSSAPRVHDVGGDNSAMLTINTDTDSLAGAGFDGYTVTYAGEDGKAISKEAFEAGSVPGRPILVTKDNNKKTAVLTLSSEEHAVQQARAASTLLKVGDTLPAFALRDLGGAPIDDATLRGKPTLLSFHFAECAPCIAEVPMLNAFARNNADMHTFAVTFDDADTATAFVQRYDFEWPVLADAKAFIDTVGVAVYPTHVLVDAAGTVRGVSTGAMHIRNERELQAWVDTALASD